MKSLLPFFMPTKVLLIDDRYTVLNMLKGSLNQEMATYKTFDNPFAAIEYINKNAANDISKKVPQKETNLLNGHIESFYEEIHDSARFEQISAIIVDYDMPGMNGLELCEKINSPHIQKIMLTGAASEKLAIEAFNNKSIDYFVQKDDLNFLEKLDSHITQTTHKYFSSITEELMNFASYSSLDSMGITDPVFIEFFNKFIEEKKFCEYYLLDSIGTYLFLSADGEPSALFVFDDLTLMDHEDMIPIPEKKPDILQDLYDYKKAICYHDFKDHPEYDSSEWKKYIYPLSPLEGRQMYFWAYVPTLPYLKRDKIISFEKYKQALSKS